MASVLVCGSQARSQDVHPIAEGLSDMRCGVMTHAGVRSALDRMRERGYLATLVLDHNGKRGRPAVNYRLTLAGRRSLESTLRFLAGIWSALEDLL